MTEISEPIPPGNRFGRFLLVEPLSSRSRDGSLRYLALDLTSMQDCEISFPRGPSEPEEQEALFRYQFTRNLNTFRQLEADGALPTPFSGGIVSDQFFTAHPWFPGISLRELLSRGPLGLSGVAGILLNLTHALVELHARGLPHGDISIDTVRILSDGSPVLLGLMPAPLRRPDPSSDFGGNPPPEWFGDPTPTAAGDVYAFALLSYQALLGKALLAGPTLSDYRRSQARLQAGLESGARFSKGIPKVLSKVLRTMLHPDPRSRPRLVESFAQALVAAVPEASVEASLRKRIGPALDRSIAEASRNLLRGVKTALDQKNQLLACSRLARFAELGRYAETRNIESASQGIRECLWESLRFDRENSEQRILAEASLSYLFRASFDLGLTDLLSLCRHQLSRFSRTESPLAGLLPSSTEKTQFKERSPHLVGYLKTNPWNETVALALALSRPLPEMEEGIPRPQLKARLTAEAGAAEAALVYQSRFIQEFPGQMEELRELGRLAYLAAEQLEDSQSIASGEEQVDAPLLAPPRVEESEAEEQSPATAQEEAEILFTRGQILIHEGRLVEAAEQFEQLVEQGALIQDHFHTALCKEVQRLLWTALTQSQEPLRQAQAFIRILALATRLDLESLLPLCDRLALNSSAQAGEPSVARLLAVRSESIILLEAAAAQAAIQGDLPTHQRLSLRLVQGLLALGEVSTAFRTYQEAIQGTALASEVGDSLASEWEETKREIEKAQALQGEADGELNLLRLQGATQDPEEAHTATQTFLERFPLHSGGLSEAAVRASRAGDPLRAGKYTMEAAARAFQRGDLIQAREGFRAALRGDPENKEALLYLAALVPPDFTNQDDLLHIRVQILQREELFEAALHLIRRELRGGPKDLPLYEMLVETSRLGAKDASPYLLAQGHLALSMGDTPLAKSSFAEACAESDERDTIVDGLLRIQGITELFNPTELLRLRS